MSPTTWISSPPSHTRATKFHDPAWEQTTTGPAPSFLQPPAGFIQKAGHNKGACVSSRFCHSLACPLRVCQLHLVPLPPSGVDLDRISFEAA